jgi:hypothetical protein
MVFVGAFIVFVTFVTKEGIREDLKDTTEVIAATRRNFIEAHEHRQILDEVETVKTTLFDTRASVLQGGKKSDWDDVRIDTQGDIAWVNSISQSVETLNAFVQQLELNRDRRTWWEWLSRRDMKLNVKLKEDLLELQKSQKDLEKSLDERTSANVPDLCEWFEPDVCHWDVGMFRARQIPFVFGASDQERKASALEAMALGLAESQKEEKERETIRATWAGRVLFAFGWGLGLVGRLYGDEKNMSEVA